MTLLTEDIPTLDYPFELELPWDSTHWIFSGRLTVELDPEHGPVVDQFSIVLRSATRLESDLAPEYANMPLSLFTTAETLEIGLKIAEHFSLGDARARLLEWVEDNR